MSLYIDLHTHSTASDGSFSPSDLILHAKNLGLKALALTDHDSIDGIKEAKKKAQELDFEFIPGIEINCKFDRELHMVGLYIDAEHPGLSNTLLNLKEARKKRNLYTIERLNEAGIEITLEEVQKHSTGDLFGRAHVAKAMVEKGYVSDTKEAFRLYLGHGKVGFTMSDRLTPEEAIHFIRESGGYPILAHCHYLKMEGEELYLFVKKLKEAGLCGLEGYYTEYTAAEQKEYLELAKKLDLKVSGGSDFHGTMKPKIQLGTGFGNLRIPYELLDQFKK